MSKGRGGTNSTKPLSVSRKGEALHSTSKSVGGSGISTSREEVRLFQELLQHTTNGRCRLYEAGQTPSMKGADWWSLLANVSGLRTLSAFDPGSLQSVDDLIFEFEPTPETLHELWMLVDDLDGRRAELDATDLMVLQLLRSIEARLKSDSLGLAYAKVVGRTKAGKLGG